MVKGAICSILEVLTLRAVFEQCYTVFKIALYLLKVVIWHIGQQDVCVYHSNKYRPK